MANKQINPERWADILARVRGRNLPKGTEGPQVITVHSPSLMRQEVTPPSACRHSRSASPCADHKQCRRILGRYVHIW